MQKVLYTTKVHFAINLRPTWPLFHTYAKYVTLPRKRTVRLTTANDRKLLRLCEETGLDINGVFNLAIADLAIARGIKVK